MWIDYDNLLLWDTFLYFLLQHTHYPQYAGPGAAGRSLRGPFGDALLELDNTIGTLLTTLEKTGVINNTLIFFTADNGLVFAPDLLLHAFCPIFISYHNSCGTVMCFSSVHRPSYIISLPSFLFDFIAVLRCCSYCLIIWCVIPVGPSWCVCPVEVTLALWNVEKAPHMRGAWESRPSPSGQGQSGQVRTPKSSAQEV